MVTIENIETSMVFITERIREDFFSFSFKRYKDDNIVVMTDNNLNLDEVRQITTKTKPTIFVGWDLPYSVLKAYYCALKGGSTNEVYEVYKGFRDVNIHNLFNFIDYANLGYTITESKFMSANLGLPIDYEKSNFEVMTDKVNNLEAIYERINKEEIESSLGFQLYHHDVLWLLKMKNTTKLGKIMANPVLVDYDGVGEYFTVPDKLRSYFDKHLPKYIEYSFTTSQVSDFKEFKKNNSKLFDIDEFDNIGRSGNGGYHSTHKTLKVFSDRYFEGYTGEVDSILSSKDYRLFHDDGSRYYPSIIVENELLSRNASRDIYYGFLEELDYLTKHDPKSLKRLNLKIAANGIYGQGGRKGGPLYDPYTQHCITAIGQCILIAYSIALYKIGGIVFQDNTDGIYIAIPRNKMDEYRVLQEEVSQVSGIKFDSDEIAELFQQNVNNYLKVYTNGKIDVVGSSSSLCGDYDNQLLSKKTYPIVSRAIYDYLLHDIPIEETIYDGSDKYDISWYILTSWVANYDFLGIAESREKTYSYDDKFEYKNIKFSGNISNKGAKIKGWNISYIFESDVVRLIPVNSNGIKVYQFKEGNAPQVVSSQNNHNLVLTKNLKSYDKRNLDIDYEFLIKYTTKILDKLFNKK